MMPGEVVIETYRLSLDYAICGFPRYCPGVQPYLIRPEFDNPFLKDHLGIMDDVYQFLDDVKAVFLKYGFPPLPGVFFCICVPYAPICLLWYLHKQRFGDINQLIEDWNRDKGREMGLYFAWNADFHAYTNTRKNLFLINASFIRL